MKSSNYSIAAHHATGDLHAMCATGYHVDGAWVHAPGAGGLQQFSPNVPVSGDYITRTYSGAVPSDQNGTDSAGNPTYQGFHIDLYNWSLLSSHTGSFAWTCDAN